MKIYLDSAHGFLFQHPADFAADVEAFLSARINLPGDDLSSPVR
jgi:hypothetical protein